MPDPRYSSAASSQGPTCCSSSLDSGALAPNSTAAASAAATPGWRFFFNVVSFTPLVVPLTFMQLATITAALQVSTSLRGTLSYGQPPSQDAHRGRLYRVSAGTQLSAGRRSGSRSFEQESLRNQRWNATCCQTRSCSRPSLA